MILLMSLGKYTPTARMLHRFWSCGRSGRGNRPANRYNSRAIMTASTLFRAIFAEGRDSRIAMFYEQREITYGELREQTIGTAEALHALGLEDGDRVAILLNDSPEFIASFVAIQSLGAIAVPINMGLRTDEQEKILS